MVEWHAGRPLENTTRMISGAITFLWIERHQRQNWVLHFLPYQKWRNVYHVTLTEYSRVLWSERSGRASPMIFNYYYCVALQLKVSLFWVLQGFEGQLRPKVALPACFRLAGFLPHCISWKIASQKTPQTKKIVSASPVSQSQSPHLSSFYRVTSIRGV